MKHMTITFEIFSFDELSKEAQDKAINDWIQELIETHDPDNPIPGVERAIKEAERMQTPWFVGSYIWDYCQKWMLETLRSPDVYYLEDGRTAYDDSGQSYIPLKGEVTFPEEVQS